MSAKLGRRGREVPLGFLPPTPPHFGLGRLASCGVDAGLGRAGLQDLPSALCGGEVYPKERLKKTRVARNRALPPSPRPPRLPTTFPGRSSSSSPRSLHYCTLLFMIFSAINKPSSKAVSNPTVVLFAQH